MERLAKLQEQLNTEQREAVLATEGPVLVIAGAGSGKTRVLTYRAAWLIQSMSVRPDEIVAVTFTNKAAGEMKERIRGLLGGDPGGIRMGTFHSLCLRILRVQAERLGYRSGFVVFDTDDQAALMKEIAADLQVDPARFPPRALLHRISAARNRFVSPEDIAAALEDTSTGVYLLAYEAYRERLRKNNAMDFDDLILNVLALFEKNAEIERRYQDRTRYLLVDEFQDTNRPQYALVSRLSAASRNLCVVGDDAQSIYRFRGAEIGNILRFTGDYPDAVTIKLTRNYRSTALILKAAGNVIRCNRGRIEKELWTDNPEGDRPTYLQAGTDRDEAAFVTEQIRSLRAHGDHTLSDIAVLYRTNFQSRLLEEALMNAGIPYRIFGGPRFYDRREIKDVLAYLKVVANPADEVSLRRVINVPARGLGKVTLMTLEEAAGAEGITLFESMRRAAGQHPPARSTRALKGLVDLIVRLRAMAEDGKPTSALIAGILDGVDYVGHLRHSDTGDAESRLENIQQLLAAAQEREGEGEPDLRAFLDGVALISDVESVTGETGVNLMTVHCAKGLEFPVVFMVGMEENLFPHARSVQSVDDDELEEERRLCYVGMTRAKKRLILSCARERRAFGTLVANESSRFIGEIGTDLLNDLSPDWLAARSYAPSRRERREPELGDEDISIPSDEEDEAGSGLRVGMKVRHDRFGYGKVEQLEGVGEKQKATVHFPGLGRKKLMTHYAKLQRIHP